MNSTSVPIFQGQYSYRKLSVAVFGGGITLVTGAVLYHLLHAMCLRPPVGKEWLAATFIIALPSLFFLGGCSLLLAFLSRRIHRLEIGDEGVAYAGKFSPWSEVSWFGYSRKHTRYLFVMRAAGLSGRRELSIDAILSQEDHERILETIKARIGPRYPEIEMCYFNPVD